MKSTQMTQRMSPRGPISLALIAAALLLLPEGLRIGQARQLSGVHRSRVTLGRQVEDLGECRALRRGLQQGESSTIGMVAGAPDASLQRKMQKTWSGLLQVDYPIHGGVQWTRKPCPESWLATSQKLSAQKGCRGACDDGASGANFAQNLTRSFGSNSAAKACPPNSRPTVDHVERMAITLMVSSAKLGMNVPT